MSAVEVPVYTCGSGTVAQALAANGHGIALVTEPPRFGLAALPATVGSAPIEVALYASWDKTHYARTRSLESCGRFVNGSTCTRRGST
jgi:hypothetical protein